MANIDFIPGTTTYTGFTNSTDTLIFKTTDADLSSTTLSSIEILKATVSTAATVFVVDQNDLAAKGQVLGVKGQNDVLEAAGTELNLASTTLSSIEILRAGTTNVTTFTVDQADLAKGGTIVGSTSTGDELHTNGNLDLTSTTLTDVEILFIDTSKATTLTLDSTDLAGLTGISGDTKDTLIVKGSTIDLSGVTMSHIEALKAVAATGATITLQSLTDLKTITGTAKTDTLIVDSATINLSSTALSSIEHLKAGLNVATTFTLDQADLAKGGVVEGSGKSDEIVAAGTSLDLTSTTLTSIEKLSAGNTKNTTLTIGDPVASGLKTIEGNTGDDTLVVKSNAIDLSSISISSIETVKAGLAGANTFTLDDSDLAGNAGDVSKILGGSGVDTLTVVGTDFDLSGTAISSIEKLLASANGTNGTTFTLEQAQLAKNGSVIGTTNGADTIAANDTGLDLTSTTLSSVENLTSVDTDGTTFTLNEGDFKNLDITGGAGNDTLVVKTTDFDLTGASVAGVETLKAGLAKATTFKVDLSDINGGNVEHVVGSAGKDTLIVSGTTDFDLSSVTLSSIEILQAGSTSATTFTLEQDDIAAKGSIIGSTSTGDTVVVGGGGTLDLSSTTLTNIEGLTYSKAGGTLTVTMDQFSQFNKVGAIAGTSSGSDTLLFAATSVDLTSATLTGFNFDAIGAGLSKATTFKLDLADVTAVGSILGNKGVDSLIVKGSEFDLSSTAASSIEKLVADSTNGTNGTLFTVDQGDLASGGSVIGSKATDILEAAGTTLDLSSTALSSIEKLQAGSNAATTFIVDQADLAKDGSVLGTGKDDTLAFTGSIVNLTSTTLSSIEILQANSAKATTFTVDADDLASGGSVIGGTTAGDTLIVKDSAFDLSSTTLTGVEILKAGVTGTTFTVDQGDLASGGQVVGGSGKDTLLAAGTSIDLTGTTLSSVEVLAASVDDTTFTVDQADLLSGGSVIANSGSNSIDTLEISGNSLNLTNTTLTGVEVLKAGTSNATTFTVDAADLAAGGTNSAVVGSTGTDTLIVKSTAFDLTSTALTSIEILQAGLATATTFKVDQADLASGGSVVGGKGIDTLESVGGTFNLTSTVLSSIEILKGAASVTTGFRLDQADIDGLKSIIGGTAGGNDVVTIHASSIMDLTSTTLTDIEIINSDSTLQTIFKVDQADLSADVSGGANTDVLMIHGTSMDLTGTTLTFLGTLTTDSSSGTTFTVDKDDLDHLVGVRTVAGSLSGVDTLVINGTELDLTSTTLDSIERVTTNSTLGTTFTLDQDDIDVLTSVIGGKGAGDTLVAVNASGNDLDISSLTLTGIETIETDTKDGHVNLKVGAQGGVTLELGAASVGSDTIIFDSAYKATTVTSDATILAHTLTIENFNAGATNDDVLDLGGVIANGTVTASSTVNVGSPTTLKAALDIAAANDGGTTSKVVTFDFGGDTYVLVDNSAGSTFTGNDAVIKLVGSHTLVDADNFLF